MFGMTNSTSSKDQINVDISWWKANVSNDHKMKSVPIWEEGTTHMFVKQQQRPINCVRYICSMEAMWHILGLQSYPASNPSVKEIKVHLPTNQYLQQQQEGKVSMLVKYLNRPQILHELKYTEFYEQYTVDKNRPRAGQPMLQARFAGNVFYYHPRITPIFARWVS